MAFRQGRFSEVTVSGVALSAYLDSAEFNTSIDLLETTTFTKTNKTYLTGLTEGTFDISGKYDPSTGGPVLTLMNLVGASNSIPIKVYPGGNAVGQQTRSFNGFLTDYTESSEVGDVVAFSASFQIDGVVTASGL